MAKKKKVDDAEHGFASKVEGDFAKPEAKEKTQADHIREVPGYLEMKPAAIVAYLTEKGITVNKNNVNQVLTKDRKGVSTTSTTKKETKVALSHLGIVKKVADEVGGMDALIEIAKAMK